MSDTPSSRVGSMFGPYHLKRLLGHGGMGDVYEAEHTVKEWPCALKLMSETFSRDPVFRERMKREARITGRLQEPHVVPIHDYGEVDGQLYLEMRLIDGTDLDSLLKRFGPLTPPRAVAIISQVASALDAAHAAGVMHRDVKPPNVLVTRDDFAYLVDFGIASATTDEKLTQLGTAVGTWKYMAPERFSNEEVTYKADIYALACVLHECLTGSPPYRADSASMLVTAHLMEPIPQPSAVRSGIPKAFDGVIARGMAKKAEDRYASAGDLALAAHEALSDPDQDHAATILRRSQEATLPGPPASTPGPTLAGTAMAPATPPIPAVTTPPPAPAEQSRTPYPNPVSSGPISGPVPQSQTGRPSWAPDSGPIPAASQRGWGGPPPGAPPPGAPPPGAPPPQQFIGPTPWNQPPPPSKRNPWPIIAAVAVVLVVAISGLGIWIFWPNPVPPPDPIPPERLGGLLLSPGDVNSIMGSSTMLPDKPITTMDDPSITLSLPACQGALYTTQNPAYVGTNYTGVNVLVSSEPGDNYEHWVKQAAVGFPSADKAKSFLKTSLDKWKACSGKTVTVNNRNKTFTWSFGQVQGSPPKIAMLDSQKDADGWQCEHVMSAANNVIVDVNACGYHITNQGGQVADKIVDKVNNE
jgi:serine/threonine kinase PknH